jgi:hypothetical protein
MFDLSRLDVVALCVRAAGRVPRYQLLHAAGVRRIRLATDIQHARALMRVSAADFLILDTADLGDTWAATAMELSEPPAVVEEAAVDSSRYGLDSSATSAFAGDLDELLGDSPVSKATGRRAGASPLLLTTPRPTVELVQHATMLGAAGVIVTPVEPQMFAQRMRAILRKLGQQAA